VNHYRLFQTLGSGAFGCVRLCCDENTGDLFAVKCISKRRMFRKGGLARSPKGAPIIGRDPLEDLKREIAILKKLEHPHIVKLFEVMDDPHHDIVYMVFELMKLGCVMDLSSKNPSNPFPEDRARLYFGQLLLAVEYLHYNHIIHRDIKPANMLLHSRDVIRLADFGVSCVFEGDDALLTKTVGTPAFLAPEAVNVEGIDFGGRAVDVWAMGATLFCLLFARPPWTVPNILELYRQIREEDPQIPAT
jgi:calcium/calmodulin-dependent protein kinase kinase 2